MFVHKLCERFQMIWMLSSLRATSEQMGYQKGIQVVLYFEWAKILNGIINLHTSTKEEMVAWVFRDHQIQP